MTEKAKNGFYYFRFFKRYLKDRVFMIIVLNMLVGILDGLGLSMFLPLLNLANGSAIVKKDHAGKIGFLLEWLEKQGLNLNLQHVLLFIAIFFILKGIAYYFKGAYQVVTHQYFIRKIRLKGVKAFAGLSYAHFTTTDTGRIQNTLTTEIERVAKANQSYFQAFQHLILIVVYVLFAFSLNWRFALMVCLGGLVIDLLYSKIYKKTKGVSRQLTNGNSVFQGLIAEFVVAYKYLKATGTVGNYQAKLNSQITDIELNNRKIGILSVFLSASREPLSVLILVAVILLQVTILNAPFATILISLLFFYRALSALMQYQTTWNSFLSVAGSLENTEQLIADLETKQEETGQLKFERLKESVVFEHVAYKYPENKVLNGLSFSIHKNEYIAIVGSSGSGKSTLANLIAGLLKPTSGTIKVDGVDLKTINTVMYQKRIGYITQDPVIFNDTIYNNVTLWASPDAENRKRFHGVCEAAAIWNLVSDGQETRSINTLNLSGGQKQRIALARELFKEVELLIMDEATSAMDSFTEYDIQKSIGQLKGKVTIVSIAHRLSTIKNADRIIYLDDGNIVQIGSFSELSEGNKAFKKIVELQTINGASYPVATHL